jgi:hypothetical protein
MTDALDVIKALPGSVVEQSYSDGVKDTLQEASKIGVDAVNTIRLALFPLQFGAALQDRLANYISRSMRRVPPEQRVAPADSLALQITEKLRFQEEGSIVTEMYISLLARAMNRDRVGEAHPAFIHLVSQLAPDEALLIQQLSAWEDCAYVRRRDSPKVPTKEEREAAFQSSDTLKKSGFPLDLSEICVRAEDLAQPDLIYTYIEHLVSLGLVVYSNDLTNEHKLGSYPIDLYRFWIIKLNQFGRLFYSACLSDSPKAETVSDLS